MPMLLMLGDAVGIRSGLWMLVKLPSMVASYWLVLVPCQCRSKYFRGFSSAPARPQPDIIEPLAEGGSVS